MKFLEKLTKNETKFQRSVGLNFKQLEILVNNISPLWRRAEKNRLEGVERKRNIGAGRPYKLESVQAKVIVVLIYYKLHLTQEFLGLIVGVDQSAISRLLKKMLLLIEEAADPTLKSYLNQAKKDCHERIGSFNELIAQHPYLRDVSTDATEQSCYRSKNYETQKLYYSGKSKQHTIKTQISVSTHGYILDVSKSYAGSIHDKEIIDQEKTIEKFDKRVPLRFDSGYQGIKKKHPDHYIILPTKKPKKMELSKLAKEHNTANSKRRVVVEHVLSRVKKFRICDKTFRQPLECHNQTFRNVAALLNLKLRNPVIVM